MDINYVYKIVKIFTAKTKWKTAKAKRMTKTAELEAQDRRKIIKQ